MPIGMHKLVVEQLTQRLEQERSQYVQRIADKDQQLAQRERELERYHQAVLANHGLLFKAADVAQQAVSHVPPPKG